MTLLYMYIYHRVAKGSEHKTMSNTNGTFADLIEAIDNQMSVDTDHKRLNSAATYVMGLLKRMFYVYG